jgi:hypothetical protein
MEGRDPDPHPPIYSMLCSPYPHRGGMGLLPS